MVASSILYKLTGPMSPFVLTMVSVDHQTFIVCFLLQLDTHEDAFEVFDFQFHTFFNNLKVTQRFDVFEIFLEVIE